MKSISSFYVTLFVFQELSLPLIFLLLVIWLNMILVSEGLFVNVLELLQASLYY